MKKIYKKSIWGLIIWTIYFIVGCLTMVYIIELDPKFSVILSFIIANQFIIETEIKKQSQKKE